MLTGLVKEIVPAIARQPGLKRVLLDLATEGQRNLKGGDIQAAAHAILSLKSALHPGGGGGTADAAVAPGPQPADAKGTPGQGQQTVRGD